MFHNEYVYLGGGGHPVAPPYALSSPERGAQAQALMSSTKSLHRFGKRLRSSDASYKCELLLALLAVRFILTRCH